MYVPITTFNIGYPHERPWKRLLKYYSTTFEKCKGEFLKSLCRLNVCRLCSKNTNDRRVGQCERNSAILAEGHKNNTCLTVHVIILNKALSAFLCTSNIHGYPNTFALCQILGSLIEDDLHSLCLTGRKRYRNLAHLQTLMILSRR